MLVKFIKSDLKPVEAILKFTQAVILGINAKFKFVEATFKGVKAAFKIIEPFIEVLLNFIESLSDSVVDRIKSPFHGFKYNLLIFSHFMFLSEKLLLINNSIPKPLLKVKQCFKASSVFGSQEIRLDIVLIRRNAESRSIWHCNDMVVYFDTAHCHRFQKSGSIEFRGEYEIQS